MIVNLYILLLLPCQPPQQEGGVADDWLSSADGVQDGRYQMGGAKEDRTAKQYHRFDCRDQIPVDHMTMFAHHMMCRLYASYLSIGSGSNDQFPSAKFITY